MYQRLATVRSAAQRSCVQKELHAETDDLIRQQKEDRSDRRHHEHHDGGEDRFRGGTAR